MSIFRLASALLFCSLIAVAFVDFASASSRSQMFFLRAQSENASYGTRPEALKHINQAIEIEPGNAGFWIWKAEILKGMEEHEQALPAVEKALQLNPKVTGGWQLKAGLLNGLARFKEALVAAERALAQEPGEKSLSSRAAVLANLKKYDLALKDINEAVKINTASTVTRTHRIRLAKDMKKWALVIEDTTFILVNKADPNTLTYGACLLDRADAYLASAKYNKAIVDYKAGLKHSPDDRKLHQGLLKAYTLTGNVKGAALEKAAIENLDGDLKPFK